MYIYTHASIYKARGRGWYVNSLFVGNRLIIITVMRAFNGRVFYAAKNNISSPSRTFCSHERVQICYFLPHSTMAEIL